MPRTPTDTSLSIDVRYSSTAGQYEGRRVGYCCCHAVGIPPHHALKRRAYIVAPVMTITWMNTRGTAAAAASTRTVC